MLHKVVLTFDSVHNILKCDHSNKSYLVVLCCGNAVIQCLTKLFFVNFFSVLGSGSLKVIPSKWKEYLKISKTWSTW